MATIGGESVGADPDSEVAAALLALNTVFTVRRPDGDLEVPALRFLRDPSQDLEGGGLVTTAVIPGAPDGAALERVAVLPSAPGPTAPAPAIEGLQSSTGDGFGFWFSGPAGESYSVLASTNLSLPADEWTMVHAGTFGFVPVLFSWTNLLNDARRFFRISLP